MIGSLVKLLTICFIFLLATGTWVITGSKKREASKRMILGLGIFLLSGILIFFILR